VDDRVGSLLRREIIILTPSFGEGGLPARSATTLQAGGGFNYFGHRVPNNT